MKRRKSLKGLFVLCAFIGTVEALVTVATASQAFILTNGLQGIAPPLSLYCWIPYFFAYSGDPAVRQHLLICLAVPLAGFLLFNGLLVYAAIMGGRRRRLVAARPGQTPDAPVRALSDSFGNADWLSMDRVKALFPGPAEGYGGIVVGEAYRVDQTDVSNVPFDPENPATWGLGGKAPLLIDPCKTGSTHGAVFAGSGGFKTTAVVIPTLLHWTGPAVIFDPACQIGPMIKRARQEMGQKVVEIRPGRGMNVLSWIDVTDPLAETHVTDLIHQLDGEEASGSKQKSENDMFSDRGREMMICILADLLWSDEPAEKKTLREFRNRVVTPEKEMKRLLQNIYATTKSPLAKQFAGSLMGVVSETFSGIYSHATTATQWLGVKAYADMVSEGDFDPVELRNGNLTVCIQIPDRSLRNTPALGRITIGTLMNIVYLAEGQIKGRVLFMLDEVNFLGRLKVLADARDGGRKYGITMVLIWQSVGQVEDTWGKAGKASWYTSTSWRLYAGVDDPETAKELSATCGTYTIITPNEGESRSYNSSASMNSSGSRSEGTTRGISERPRELIRPEEISTTMRSDEQIMIVKNTAPIRCGRAIFYRRPEMVKLVDDDRFRMKQTEAAE